MFNDLNFQQIDFSIFYMFKLFQATQAQIYSSLDYAILRTEQ